MKANTASQMPAKGFWKEYYVYDVTQVLTPGTGTQAANQNLLRTDSDADFELTKLTYVANFDQINVQMRDDSSGRYLIQYPIDIKDLAGRNTLAMGQSNSFLPFILPMPYVISAASNFTTYAQDYSNQANTLRLALQGGKIRKGTAPWDYKWRAQIPFWAPFTQGAVTVSPLGTATQNLETDIDAHFLIQKILAIRTGDALVNIYDNSRGQSWMNNNIHIDNVAGNGAFPNVLPAPRFIQRGAVLTVNITNLTNANNTINFVFVGKKLYE
jgi:hypothetical protein